MSKMKWILILLGVALCLILISSISYRLGSSVSTKEADKLIKQKDTEIKQLEEQLKFYEKEIQDKDMKIASLRRQRQEIKKPVSDEELINRFKALGYDISIYYK